MLSFVLVGGHLFGETNTASDLVAAIPEAKADAEFGADVQLAPFVVNGKKVSISILARTKADRRYGEEFAEAVVAITYQTMGKSTGKGLVVIGREGEPHPVTVMRKFLALAAAGSLDPAIAAKAAEMNERMSNWKATFRLNDVPEVKKSAPVESNEAPDEGKKEEAKAPEEKGFKLSFEILMPALPLPLEGVVAKLYQLSWAEGFDDARIEKKLRSLTLAELESDTFSKYDWVFYLPPRDAFVGVQNDVLKAAAKQEK